MPTRPFTSGNHDLPKIVLTSSDGARAEVYVHGAHVTAWLPAGDRDRLYLSGSSLFQDGAAIRGGVPVVFPQFSGWGPLPKHGFARNRAWELVSVNDGSARFQLRDSAETRAIWPHAFLVEFSVTVRERQLIMELAITNHSEEPFNFTAALHTYLSVADIAATRIENVKGLKYFDAVLKQEAVQTEAITFAGEIDRVYFDPAELMVNDGERSLAVRNSGFPDGVIWNPGAELAAKLGDLDPDGYRRFVCVEAAIFRAPITLQPYQTWRGGQTLSAEPRDEFPGESLWGDARVREVLAAKRRHLIVAAAPTDRVREIIERLKIHDISQMPVLSEGKLTGLITEATLLAHLAVPGHTVEDTIAPMINHMVSTVEPDQPAAVLLSSFGSGQAVVVVEGDRVLGILTKLDLIEFLTARLK